MKEDAKLDATIRTKVTQSEYDRLAHDAERMGVSVSEVARMYLRDGMADADASGINFQINWADHLLEGEYHDES